MEINIIEYWLKTFQKTNTAYITEDNQKLYFSKVMEELKELKIQCQKLKLELERKDKIIEDYLLKILSKIEKNDKR